MALATVFKTTTRLSAPLDGRTDDDATATTGTTTVSDFLTVQSLTNFAAMTGAITASWNALARLSPDWFSGLWVPYAFAVVFGIVSLATSGDAFKKEGKFNPGQALSAIFIAVINSLVLASAVVGVSSVTSTPAR